MKNLFSTLYKFKEKHFQLVLSTDLFISLYVKIISTVWTVQSVALTQHLFCFFYVHISKLLQNKYVESLQFSILAVGHSLQIYIQ